MQSNSTFNEIPIPVAEAAEIAKVSPRTIHRWIKRGWVKRYGAGRLTRVLMSDVLPERPVPPPRVAIQ